MKKATSNAESFNNLLRFSYPALVLVFIVLFGIVAHLKIGDHSIPHRDVDSWNQTTNETMIIRSSENNSIFN
jgi:hypothetical protein